MLAFLKRTFVVLLGLLLIFVIIWFAGPLFAFADYRPLGPESARLILFAVIVGCWLIASLLKRLRAFRASDRLLAAVVAQPQPQAKQALPPAEVVKLRERFEEATKALRQGRRGGHSLYDLPWYVIIGAPGSGKTTALLNSGLKFPLEQRVGKGALRGVGGTRNCDWWFTDEAVFLDTAGRYTTQDSDPSSDSVGWGEFLALLRKHRARRPVNGVILTVNAQDLLLLDTAGRDAHIDAARSRLDELNRGLRIQLPVYLMVTKCDLVDGFAEYFESLTAEGRAQVWGVTFPYEESLANHGPDVFPAEFDALMTRLNERVFERVEEARQTRRRTKVFAFPQQMATLRGALTGWVTDVFDASDFRGRIFLRGVYFTSGTQEGTPIDRLLGSIGRGFGASEAVMRPAGPGKAYFVENLLKEVMIGESGLAGVNRRLELRNASALLGVYIATGLVAAAGVAALSVSYSANREYLDEAAAHIAALERTAAVNAASPLDQVARRLDAIRAVVESSERYRTSTSWLLRWGLYQGRSIGNAAQDAYVRELDNTLLPRVASQIKVRLTQHATDPQKLFDYLKGYLMLGDPRQRLDKEHLQMLADREWQTGAGHLAASLSQHFKALLDNGASLRPLPLDGTLVAQARSSGRLLPMAKILYAGLKDTYAGDDSQGLRVDQLAGLDVERVFTRRSRVPMSTPLPRLYTRDVFKRFTQEGRAELVAQLAKDAWVWGDSTAGAVANAGTLVSAVTIEYEQDYIRAWDALLDDLQFVSFQTVQQANDALRILTAPSSPLRGLLRVVSDHTTLVENAPAAPAPKGVIAETRQKVTDRVAGILKPIQDAAGVSSGVPGRMVTAHFQWVRQLSAGEAGKTQLDVILQTLTQIQQQLDRLGPDVAGERPVQTLSSPSFRVLMQTLRQQVEALPPGLRTLLTEIAETPGTVVTDAAAEEIKNLYDAQVVPTCSRLIANRYPFANASTDVQLADFSTVFGYGGLYDKFFADHLEKQADTSGAEWSWLPGSVELPRLLEQFHAARRVRDMFFEPGSKTAAVNFFVSFSGLDSGAQRFVLQIDGQILDNKHARWPVKWPGPAPGNATTAFEARYYDPPRHYGGPWAWLRMVDQTRDGAPDAQQRIRLKVQDRYHYVTVTVEPGRAGDNPFATGAWRQFSCGS
jgi:type VI secretion system protein ImpL